jgi:type I restriction enzyme S subunit
MEEWKEYRLGDLFERVTRKNANLESDNVLTISAQQGLINQEEFFNKSVAGKNLRNYYLLKKEEFAYNKSYSAGYPVGATKMLSKYDEGIVSTLYICFKSKSDLVINKYFEYYFESKQYYDELSKIVQEGARNHGLLNVSTDDFFNIKLKLPTKCEQEKIVKILKTVDEIIEKKTQRINNEKLQKKYYFSNAIKNIDYREQKLSDIAMITMGQSPDSKSYTDDCQYTPLIQGNADIINRKICPKKYTTKPTKICKEMDLIMTVRAPVGYVAKSTINACIGRGVCSIRLSDVADKEYVYQYLIYNEENWNKLSQGSTFDAINSKEIKNMTIRLPKIEMQKSISRILEIEDKIIEKLECEINEYHKIKITLMKKLLLGKVKANV